MGCAVVSTRRLSRRTLLQGGAGIVIGASAPGYAARASTAPARLDADVIVIGAGLAGLNAALWLEESGAGVLMLVLMGSARPITAWARFGSIRIAPVATTTRRAGLRVSRAGTGGT